MIKQKVQFATPLSIQIDKDFLARELRLLCDISSSLSDGTMDLDASVNAALMRIGELLDVSRVYVMMNEKDGRYLKNTHEWVNRDIPSAMFFSPAYDQEKEIRSLRPMLAGIKTLGCSTRDMPDDLREVLMRQNIDSVLLTPMMRGGVWIGLVGFDSCVGERYWTEEEGSILCFLSDFMVAILDRQEMQILRKKMAGIRGILTQGIENFLPAATVEKVGAQPPTLREAERRIITETLELYNGNKLRAAKHLGLTWPALDRRCKKLGVMVRKGG